MFFFCFCLNTHKKLSMYVCLLRGRRKKRRERENWVMLNCIVRPVSEVTKYTNSLPLAHCFLSPIFLLQFFKRANSMWILVLSSFQCTVQWTQVQVESWSRIVRLMFMSLPPACLLFSYFYLFIYLLIQPSNLTVLCMYVECSKVCALTLQYITSPLILCKYLFPIWGSKSFRYRYILHFVYIQYILYIIHV